MNLKSQPLEIERKFLIEYPDTALLDRLSGGNRSEISQIYLVGEKGTSERIRARTRDGVTVYTHNVKVKLSHMVRIENEEEISVEEYNEFLKRADKSRRTIEKIRYCIPHGELVCEIDLFPFWSDKAFLEIEMPSEDTEITLPDFVKLIREVTDDNRYTNNALAKEIPE